MYNLVFYDVIGYTCIVNIEHRGASLV